MNVSNQLKSSHYDTGVCESNDYLLKSTNDPGFVCVDYPPVAMHPHPRSIHVAHPNSFASLYTHKGTEAPVLNAAGYCSGESLANA